MIKVRRNDVESELQLERILLIAPKSLIGELQEFIDNLPLDLLLDQSNDDEEAAPYRKIVFEMTYGGLGEKDGVLVHDDMRCVSIYPQEYWIFDGQQTRILRQVRLCASNPRDGLVQDESDGLNWDFFHNYGKDLAVTVGYYPRPISQVVLGV